MNQQPGFPRFMMVLMPIGMAFGMTMELRRRRQYDQFLARLEELSSQINRLNENLERLAREKG